jgi:hypothetical protein
MTAIASDPIHLGAHPAAWNRVAIDQGGGRGDDAVLNRTRAVTLSGRVRAISRDQPVFSLWSWSTLMDGVMLLGVVWSLPVAVLVVGTPVALGVAFLLWLVRLALGAF